MNWGGGVVEYEGGQQHQQQEQEQEQEEGGGMGKVYAAPNQRKGETKKSFR